ncbi:MAG: hypothetical protein AVDCRST_MAG95-1582, partial [uncultured Adhaeribacter sp.]
ASTLFKSGLYKISYFKYKKFRIYVCICKFYLSTLRYINYL